MDGKQLNSPLNQAHRFARIAESCERSAKFVEARRFHRKAIEFLEKSAKIATFASTQESIRLQIEYHERQQEVVSLRELQYAVQRKIDEQHQKHMLIMMEQQPEVNLKRQDETLQWAIFRNMEATDSLINTLAERDSSKPDDESEAEVNSGTVYNNGVKHPKSETIVIEELRILNCKLKELISQQVIQVEDSKRKAEESEKVAKECRREAEECRKEAEEYRKEAEESRREADALRAKVRYYESRYEWKSEAKGTSEENLIDFNSMSSSGESVGIMP